MTSPSREFAFKLLSQWTTLASPPLVPERGDEAFEKLPPRDRAFAFDLITGILRWRNLLDAMIASRLKQPLETIDLPVRALLWLGAYQLLLQAGTTPYAAVDSTVALAGKFRHTSRAGGLINAVLRGITRLNPQTKPAPPGVASADRLSRRAFALDFATDLHFAENVFPDPTTAFATHLAAVRSHPVPLVEHLRRLYPHQTADLLLRNNLRPVVTLRADADAIDAPAAAGLAPHASERRFLVAAEGWNAAVEKLVRAGILSPQDPTAAKPVRRVSELLASGKLAFPSPTPRILDLCAGLGTKSLQLARAFPQATVIASDVDSVKLARLEQRVRQVGQKNIETCPAEAPPIILPAGGEPAPHVQAITPGSFDLVLVDVPCSNTGVMAKRVQSRWRWPSLDHAQLHSLQRRLLAQGAAMLAPGGFLVYATCSIDPAENGDIVATLTSRTSGRFRVIDEALTLPSLPIGLDPHQAALSTHDGGYFAVLTIEP